MFFVSSEQEYHDPSPQDSADGDPRDATKPGSLRFRCGAWRFKSARSRPSPLIGPATATSGVYLGLIFLIEFLKGSVILTETVEAVVVFLVDSQS